MFRKLVFCFVMLQWMGGPGLANEWTFYFGPQLGEPMSESYTAVYSGSNAFLVHGYGEKVSLAANVRLDTFDNGGAVERSLQAGLPLKLDVLRESDRYERVIPSTEYAWRPKPGENQVVVVFRLTADDLFAMVEGRALFLWSDSLQFRFGLDNADAAIGKLVTVLRDGAN